MSESGRVLNISVAVGAPVGLRVAEVSTEELERFLAWRCVAPLRVDARTGRVAGGFLVKGKTG